VWPRTLDGQLSHEWKGLTFEEKKAKAALSLARHLSTPIAATGDRELTNFAENEVLNKPWWEGYEKVTIEVFEDGTNNTKRNSIISVVTIFGL